MNATRKITVFGSSVAAGWVTSLNTQYDMENGYISRLSRLLADRGWTLHTFCVPGDTTTGVLERIKEPLQTLNPEIAIIALSMSNEGLETEDPEKVYQKYKTGLKSILEVCEQENVIPVVGLCYANDNYSPKQYECLKNMNCDINTWDVPCINLLGAFDDGKGHFPGKHTFEGDHPDNRGHEEFFYACVPGLFNALISGIKIPRRVSNSPGQKVMCTDNNEFLVYIPDDIIHSFSMVYSFQTRHSGCVSSVAAEGKSHEISITSSGTLLYHDVESAFPVNDGQWHEVALTHGYLHGKTSVYLDGKMLGQVREQIEPDQFTIGRGNSPEKSKSHPWSYRDIFIYRAALNEMEIEALYKGDMIHASMEIYAPLNDHSIRKDSPVNNLALSNAVLIVDPSDTKEKICLLRNKIDEAARLRMNEYKFKDKEPIDMDPKEFDSFEGFYEIAPGDHFEVTRKSDSLIFIDRGQEMPLLPEAENTFFIKYPGELTVTFIKDDAGLVEALILNANGQTIQANKRSR
jgi:lysophospholipase L1-like esterase